VALGDHQPAIAEAPIGGGDGRRTDCQAARELTNGGEAVAGAKGAATDAALGRLGNRAGGAPGDVVSFCHNLRIVLEQHTLPAPGDLVRRELLAGGTTHAGGESRSLSLMQRWMSATSGKWALPILDCLVEGGSRYNRLLESLEPVSHKVLTQTLRRLEMDGLITCEPVGKYGRLYRLTECGRQVRERLTTLHQLAVEMTS
jgi:DNA-binding HxlR family transcriptional regulator